MAGLRLSVAMLLSSLLACSGCAGLSKAPARTAAAVNNPVVLTNTQEEIAWEQVVDVLHEYHFNIERENRQARTIETKYRVGSGILEPWHQESVGWYNRVESTLQSIRRKVIVTLAPAGPGNYAVQVVALKEMEDLNAIAANSPGGATFQESAPLERDVSQVVGASGPSGWISMGRDVELERALLASLTKHVNKQAARQQRQAQR